MAGQQRSTKLADKRSYTMRQRQAHVDETRARIVDATIELYETLGPSGTTMSGVADRAGVTRATLYRHFPGDDALADAAVAAWREGWSSLDPAALRRIGDPAARLLSTLTLLYGGYRATEAMTANLARDAHALPEAHRAAAREPAATAAAAIGPLGGRKSGRVGAATGAVVGHAVAFETWQSLRAAGMTDAAIAELMARFVGMAADATVAGAAASADAEGSRAGRVPGRAAANATAPSGSRTRPAAATAGPRSSDAPTPRAAITPAAPPMSAPKAKRARRSVEASVGPAAKAPRAKAAREKAGRDKTGKKAKAERKGERKAKRGPGRGA